MRLKTYREPLERDIGIYAVAAEEIINGKILYKDVWDTKAPGIFLIYLFARLFTNYGETQVFFINFFGNILLMFGIFLSTRALSENINTALLSASIFTVFSGDILLQANQPNAELFVNIFLVFSLLFAIFAIKTQELKYFILSGIFTGLATTVKQFSPILLCLIFILTVLSAKEKKKLIYYSILSFLSVFLCWVPFFIYFYFSGALADFIYINFEFPFFYSKHGSSHLTLFDKVIFLFNINNFYILFVKSIWTLLPAFILFFLSLLYFKEGKFQFSIVLLYFISAFIMIVLPWKFYPHYYQLLLPPLCIGTSIGQKILFEIFREKKSFFLFKIFILIFVLVILIIHLPPYFMPAEWWSQKKYGPLFIYCKEVGKEISEITQKNDKIFQWGYEATLYFYSQRRPATGRFIAAPYLYGKKSEEYTRRTLEEFKNNPPDLVILPSSYDKNHPLLVWIMEHYEPFEDMSKRKSLEYKLRCNALDISNEIKPITLQQPIIPPIYFYKKKK
ncbi:MAG TPA: glycosyltransferase family 39 protein [Victivallales bacterium]|nr:glycosyltransferase family 39 protein [Victivallales bacterium]HPO89488.1 glycosyltransferase family 39 protein [Victivallales bacterium]